jgi:hypothetical protein
MFKKSYIRYTVAAVFVAGALASNSASAVDEMEPNSPIASGHRVEVGAGGSIEIKGAIGAVLPTQPISNDLDFYSFEGREGDVVSIDIDNGKKPTTSTERSVDTIVALFGPGPLFKKLAENDQSPLATLDTGSLSKNDSYIDSFRLPAAGVYTVGVTAWSSGRQFRDGGALSTANTAPTTNGSYTLIISGLKPPVLVINIDIRPGSTDVAPFNPKARGNIPVALLSSSEFDAVKVDRDSLTFGANGTEDSLQRCGKEGTDVDGDGRLDLVCHFDNQKVGFGQDHSMGKLMGKTDSGQLFEGTGLLKIVPMRQE